MRVPESLITLIDQGAVDEVLRPLMSGKEAEVYLVVSGGRRAVAKVYKEAINRSFKHRAEYTEGRKVRNSRDQRAIDKRSKHGREQDESAWRSTEVDMIRRLHAAGVRVPVPSHFMDGVLVMELIVDAAGNPAPRLGDVGMSPERGRAIFDGLLREVVKMLSAGVVHGDLSEFNVLLGGDGPVIIDFPQSVDTARNTNARRLLLRDVDNLYRFLCRCVPAARRFPYAEEMWRLYEQNMLTPDTRLRGHFHAPTRRANTASVIDLIQDADRDERKRRDALGLRGGPEEPGIRPVKIDTGSGGFKRGGPTPPVYQGKPNGGLSLRGGYGTRAQHARGKDNHSNQGSDRQRHQSGQGPPTARQPAHPPGGNSNRSADRRPLPQPKPDPSESTPREAQESREPPRARRVIRSGSTSGRAQGGEKPR